MKDPKFLTIDWQNLTVIEDLLCYGCIMLGYWETIFSKNFQSLLFIQLPCLGGVKERLNTGNLSKEREKGKSVTYGSSNYHRLTCK